MLDALSGCEKLSWQAIWLNVPISDNMEKSWTYIVKEVDASGADWHSVDYVKNRIGMTVTNTYVPPMDAAFTAIKIWNGGYSTEHIAVPLTLWRQIEGGQIEQVTGVNPGITPDPGTSPTSDVYSYSWTGLPATDAQGNLYTYYATEELYKYYQRQYSSSITDQAGTEYCTAKQNVLLPTSRPTNRLQPCWEPRFGKTALPPNRLSGFN